MTFAQNKTDAVRILDGVCFWLERSAIAHQIAVEPFIVIIIIVFFLIDEVVNCLSVDSIKLHIDDVFTVLVDDTELFAHAYNGVAVIVEATRGAGERILAGMGVGIIELRGDDLLAGGVQITD